MSRIYTRLSDKHQKQPKVHQSQYLSNPGEPADDLTHDLPIELQVELMQNSSVMRHNFRHIAYKLRN